MSLLMQALKKAERAKLNHVPDEGLVSPSEEFDPVLTLAPQDPYVAAPRSSTLRPDPELSLTPLADDGGPWEAAPRPHAPAASSAERAEPAEPLSAAEPPAPSRPSAPPPRKSGAARTAPPAKGVGKPVRAARAMTLDPQTLRLLVLGGIALLVILLLALLYWRAVLAPGPGSSLPPVPMPAQQFESSNATPLTLVTPPADGALPADMAAQAQSQAQSQPQSQPFAQAPAQDGAQPTVIGPAAAPGADAMPTRSAYGNVPDAAASPIVSPSAAAAPSPALNQAAAADTSAAGQMAVQAAPRQASRSRRDTPSAPVGDAVDGAGIKVRRSDAAPQVSPTLQAAFQAYSNGDNATARQQYTSMLQREPNNRDALLGLAAVSLREHQQAQAASIYLRLLELDPNDSDAVAGLVGLRHGDPQQSEARLKTILERSPEAGPALFALGNLYAQQARWPEAQQIFFRAYSSTPTNPDYAFNLAVGLDHLNQPRLALQYYQRALALASDSPGTFDRTAARRRLHEISGAVTPPAQP